MSAQNSLQVASGDAIEVTHTPANNKKCSTKSMLLLGMGTVFVVVGIALGAYHAGTDAQKSAANSALESVKEKIEGIFGGEEEQLAAIVDVLDDASASSEEADFYGGTVTTDTNVTVTVDLDTPSSKSGKSASSKSMKKSSGTASPTTDMLSGKSGKVGDAKSSKSGVVTTSSPSTDGLTTSSPTDSLPAGAGSNLGEEFPLEIEKDEVEATAEIAFMSLSQAEYSMSMFGRRQYN